MVQNCQSQMEGEGTRRCLCSVRFSVVYFTQEQGGNVEDYRGDRKIKNMKDSQGS